MVLYMRRWVQRVKFMLLFCVCTFVLYHLLLIFSEWVEPMQKYKEPSGRAVKVFQHQHASISDLGSMSDRLRLFYWYGE
ncbi:DUF4227 family protein [Paenibacillus hamazuiensis]|uniref:DUF4227 family protein n=1 Tax=Paenibacillus hamazuiensis TaxID=2936508 RepID=UPI00200D03B7|nr:DUF4227 family protein [Paenibacillus hamazuiensis]